MPPKKTKKKDKIYIFDTTLRDGDQCPGAAMNAGQLAVRLGLSGWPAVAEEMIIERDIRLNDGIGCRYHVQHVLSAGSIGIIRQARQAGAPVTAEVSPHHLLLTEDACAGYNTMAKMNPPLRSADDIEALKTAVADGTVTVLATDHAPHHHDEKSVEFSCAPFGVVGLETAVSLCLDRLVHGGVIDLRRMIELFTTGPCDILRLDKGRLRKGGDADITVLDTERLVTVNPQEFASKGLLRPLAGAELKGAPVMTIYDGRVVFDAR